ncbi:ATP-dependent DNA helicase yku80 [Thecaphora frezii]
MSVVPNSLTLFVLDISAPMRSPRLVQEKVSTPTNGVQLQQRTTTDLQWVCDFVAARIAEIILRGLKTTKVAIITYGSPRTNNVVNDGGIRDEYEGIDEIFPPALPTLDTLDLVRSLRAVDPNSKTPPGDPLSALVDAIQLSNSPQRGGIKDSQKNTWRRTIYLVTDGRSRFSWDGADAIKDKILDENLQLRVLGVDFDDPEIGFKEEHKDELKRANEQFWHDFLSEIPTARIATAIDAVEQANLPTVQITRPAPLKMSLSFGDPADAARHESIHIPVAMYKITDVQRPMTQSKISKLACESDAASRERELAARKKEKIRPSSTPTMAKDHDGEGAEPAPVPSYKAEVKREYFLLDEISGVERGRGGPKPLPQEAERSFTRAWKLGASLVPVEEEAFGQMDTRKGLEVLHFTRASTYRREYNLEQIWYVFADQYQVKAQIQLSSLVRGLAELDLIAIVRVVRKDKSEPELGVLWPCIEQTFDCFYYSRVPFREDVRRFIFPPLDRIITKEGNELFEGPSIPTAEEQEMVDAFVDAMDLMDVTTTDDGAGEAEAEASSWFSILDSFNPAIHMLKTAVRHRFVHPDSNELPGPHPELVKYFEPPKEVRRRSEEAVRRCRERFRIHYVPPKNNTERKKRLANEGPGADWARESKQESKRIKQDEKAQVVPPEPPAKRTATGGDDDSETEDEGDNADGAAVQEAYGAKEEPPSQTLALTQPSARIGTATPVEHFLRLVESEDDVTQVFVEMLDTITHLLQTRAYELVVACCCAAKRVAQEYEEAIRWNRYVRSLKIEARRQHSRFWNERMRGRLDVGLVTEEEDEARQSDVKVEDAREFIEEEDGDEDGDGA